MSDMIRDVDESLKQDRLHALWKEYGSTIITAAILLVLVTAIMAGYRGWKENKLEEDTALYLQAADSENSAEALADLAPDLSGGLQSLAYLNAGGEFFVSGNMDKARENYQLLAESGKGDMAGLGAVLYNLLALNNDSEDLNDDMVSALEDVANDSDSPWRNYALYTQALVVGNAEGDYEQAISLFEKIREDRAAPVVLQTQIMALSQLYTRKIQGANNSQ